MFHSNEPTVPTTSNTVSWIMPTKPITLPVDFNEKDGGLYISKDGSVNLLKNIEAMDAYTEKLEVLVKEMKEYYGTK